VAEGTDPPPDVTGTSTIGAACGCPVIGLTAVCDAFASCPMQLWPLAVEVPPVGVVTLIGRALWYIAVCWCCGGGEATRADTGPASMTESTPRNSIGRIIAPCLSPFAPMFSLVDAAGDD
jgi:hypothetical protein